MNYFKIYTSFRNLKIQYKIFISTILLSLFLIIFTYFSTILSLRNAILEDSLKKIHNSQELCIDALTKNYNRYMFNFNKVISQPDFQNIISSIDNQTKSPSENKLLLQDSIDSLISINSLVEMVYFIDNYGNIYQSYGTFYNNENDFKFFDTKQIKDITVFPERKNPFSNNNNVIPIIIPLTIKNLVGDNHTKISTSSDNTLIFTVILINSNLLIDTIKFWYSEFDDLDFLLIDNNHTIILTSNPKLINNELYIDEYKRNINFDISKKENSTFQLKLKNTYITETSLSNNLSIICSAPINTLSKFLSTLKQYMILSLMVGLIITTYITFFISHFVSKPIKQLAKIVDKIKNDSYSSIKIPTSCDEVGQLNSAINEMYLTIQTQIKQIKIAEKEKYKAEINLLSEQINPHLLYNTLEFINMEIINNNSEVASDMIQSLANYMRITLSYSNKEILIQDEIRQVDAYLKIMNYRFHNNIVLLSNVPDNLKNCYITKTILQPFIENSIKYGFCIESEIVMTFNPIIYVNFNLIKDRLYIEICDNGIGFNVEKVYDILYKDNKSNKKHLGLRNVLKRLEVRYGDVDININSIPYFKTEIIINFPYN